MDSSLFRREILPFLLVLGGLVLATVAADALLHGLDLQWIGRWLGIPGVVLILISFLYSLHKRKLITSGNPRTLLTLHETLAWLGTLMILVHAGVHVYTILPWLALVAMLVNAISGMTGQYLLKRPRQFLAAKREHYLQQGLTEVEIEKALFRDAVAFDLMKKWRVVHMPISLAFAVLGIAHILSILLFWQWK